MKQVVNNKLYVVFSEERSHQYTFKGMKTFMVKYMDSVSVFVNYIKRGGIKSVVFDEISLYPIDRFDIINTIVNHLDFYNYKMIWEYSGVSICGAVIDLVENEILRMLLIENTILVNSMLTNNKYYMNALIGNNAQLNRVDQFLFEE